ncbi:MAG: alpha/beta hydrolase [Myxococcaceae bacterium]|nr:alpha/beta hydrolase [Myxococcaceae bacterium]
MRCSRLFSFALACLLLTGASSCVPFPTVTGARESLPLWPHGHPLTKGNTEYDIPRLFLFPAPEQGAKNTVVIVASGGSYGHQGGLTFEGLSTVRWLNAHGITAALLRYRVAEFGGYDYRAILDDATRAVQLLRRRAADAGGPTPHIGVIGFSAGGHLAGWLATGHGQKLASAALTADALSESSQVDFAIMVYPVVTLEPPYAHQRSRNNLLHGIDQPDDALIASLSLENRVHADQPPTLLIHSRRDAKVDFHNSLLFYEAAKKAGASAELLLFDDGGHGVGLSDAAEAPQMSTWPEQSLAWMRRIGVLE